MLTEEQHFRFKLKALELANTEQMEKYGVVHDLDELFDTATRIYDAGLRVLFFENESIYSRAKATTEPPKEKKTAVKKTTALPTKICPKCGDHVPIGYTVHLAGSQGKCGYKWTK